MKKMWNYSWLIDLAAQRAEALPAGQGLFHLDDVVDQLRLLVLGHTGKDLGDLVVEMLVALGQLFIALGCKGYDRGTAVGDVGMLGDEAQLAEVCYDAAHIAGIYRKIFGKLFAGRLAQLFDLMEDADLGNGDLAVVIIAGDHIDQIEIVTMELADALHIVL